MLRTAENPIPPSFQSNPQKFQQRVNAAPSERILVVEDDHAVQKALRRLFEAEGYADCSGRMVVSGFLLCAASPPLLFSINSRELQLRVLLIVQFSKPAAEPLTIFLHTGPTAQSFS